MRRIKQALKLLVCIIIGLATIGAASPAAAAAATETTPVRVGFFAFDGYHMQDGDGNRSGYGYELLQQMAGYAGLQYEYVGYDKSWNEMQDMLDNGEIDILTSAQKTDERLERFDFSAASIGTSAAILTTWAGNYTYQPEDYRNWNGMRIGMIVGNSRNDSLADFALEQGFNYEPVYFEDTTAMIDALKNAKSVDAILTSNLRRTDGEGVLAQFAASPFYIMVQKGNTQLLEKIDHAITQMDNYEPGYRTRLHNKYYPINSSADIFFSAEEQGFIANMGDTVFTALINPDRAPYSYIKDGKLNGSMYDAAAEIIARSGLNVEFVIAKDRAEYWQLVKSAAADIRFDADLNYNQAEAASCWLTPSYLEVPVARLYREDATLFSSVAVLRNSNITEDYGDILAMRDMPFIYYDSVAAIAAAVLADRRLVALLPLNTAAVAVRDDVTNRLATEIVYGYSTLYSVAVRTDQSPLLFSILNKSVLSLNEQDMNRFSLNYADDLAKPFSLIGYIYDYPLHIVIIVISVILVLLLILGLLNLSKRRELAIQQMQREKNRNEQLQDALNRAKMADEAKSTFLSRVSHEIRTPLNAVIGYNVIAKSGMADAKTDAERRQAEMKVLDYLTKSEIASKHLLTIINDVLDMSAIESGKIKVAHERFDFRGLVTSLTTVFYSQARAKDVDFEVIFDTLTEEWFVGDQMRINQILVNLLSNAVKFTPKGGMVTLKISQPEAAANASHIHFEVTDTGIGMTPEYLRHIWAPFEQADSSISRRFGGTGLGLSITKNLVDIMGGSITVQSEPGKGTTFGLDLTFARTEQPSAGIVYDFSKINALAVDDDASTCDYIRLLFNRCGAKCAAVTSGLDALKAVSLAQKQGEGYSLCLIDWQMPQMDGIETIRRIRSIAGDEMPIIVLTAYDYTELADRAAEVGVSKFIAKPLFQSTLFDLLTAISETRPPLEMTKNKGVDFTGARVLLAEDNVMNMEIAKAILKSAGLVVDSVHNGKEAVEAFEAAPAGTYMAILMDVHMPEMNGHDATRTIRASDHPEAKTIPIIAMTADAFTEDVAESSASGMNAHISKPIDVPALFATLAKYMRS